jgi:cyanate permease
MTDPFAERSTPWWRRPLGGSRRQSAPKPYSMAAGVIGSLAALAFPLRLHGPERALALSLLAALPPVMVERWWRQRHRREEEELFPVRETRARSQSSVGCARS